MNELQWTWLSLVAVLPFIFGGLLSGCRPDYLSESPRLLAQICILRLHSICWVRVLRLTSSAVSSRGSAVILLAPDGGPASGVASGPLDIFPFGWMIESSMPHLGMSFNWPVGHTSSSLSCLWAPAPFSSESAHVSWGEPDCAAPELSQVLTVCCSVASLNLVAGVGIITPL